jgi:transposase InsO family protein
MSKVTASPCSCERPWPITRDWASKCREVLTDNGGGYRSQLFAQACRDLAIHHRFTRAYTPRTNGKAERFIQTALREWAYARAYARSEHRFADLPRWLHGYNWHRPHASFGSAATHEQNRTQQEQSAETSHLAIDNQMRI